MPTSRAFTLIELLVVVAIIAVLVAILLPSLSAARETARRTACSANVNQIGVVMRMYVNEYGKYPCVMWPTTAECNWQWPAMLKASGLVRSHGLYGLPEICASDVDLFPAGMWRCPSESSPATFPWWYQEQTLYGINCHYFQNRADWSYLRSEGDIERPSELMWMADSTYKNGSGEGVYGLVKTGGNFEATAMSARHGASINFLYCDGHVAAKRFEDLKTDHDFEAGQ